MVVMMVANWADHLVDLLGCLTVDSKVDSMVGLWVVKLVVSMADLSAD